jgi:argininosuccinate lyase
VKLVAVSMPSAEFDVERMRARAGESGVTATELADTLARDHGLSFRAGHAIARRVVLGRAANQVAPLSELVNQAAQEIGLEPIDLPEKDLERILSPEHFVEVRRTLGGPAPDVTAKAIAESRARLKEDLAATAARRQGLESAEARLKDAARAL